MQAAATGGEEGEERSADLREGPACGRAFRFVGESEDGYLAAAWDLALAS